MPPSTGCYGALTSRSVRTAITPARTSLRSPLPHQQLISTFLDRTDGRTLLTFLDEQLSNPGFSARRIETADTVLSHIEALLRRISSFRAVHLRLAQDNLQLRPKPVGSGGHTAELLAQLAAMTGEARGRVQGMRRRLRAQTC